MIPDWLSLGIAVAFAAVWYGVRAWREKRGNR